MLPRATRQVAASAAAVTRQHALANSAILSSSAHRSKIGSIHTKKQQQKKSPSLSPQSPSSRWFSSLALPAMAMPSMPAMPALPSIPKPTLPAFPTWPSSSATCAKKAKSERIMARVWQKRQQKLAKATSAVMDTFKTQNLCFSSAEIYIRKAGSFDDAEDNGQREVHIALRGIAHTVVVLRHGGDAYLLDRVVEGIRLTQLEVEPESRAIVTCAKFKPNEMLRLSAFEDVSLSSRDIAEWVEVEGARRYHVLLNSCVNFSFYFYQRFLCGLKAKRAVQSVRSRIGFSTN